MTGRTHDLAAFTILLGVASYQVIPNMSLATLIVAVSMNLAGGVTPDIDQPTAQLWRRIPAGSLLGRIISPLLGSHRMLSHSAVGITLAGVAMIYILRYVRNFLIVDMELVWWAYMWGYLSHLLADSLTKEGVPWLFPIPWKIGFPPLKFLRITTGTWAEKMVLVPIMVIANGFFITANYQKFINLFTNQITK